jgi:serine/threonine protein kinase/Flp pilus assembly protein TadD
MAQLDEAAVFDVAWQIEAPTVRRLYLEQACAGDLEMLSRLEALLRVHDEDSEFLQAPAEGVPDVARYRVAEGPGTHVGSYKVLEKIGEGGFGIVFMAEQSQPVQRKVALKIIKPGMDTAQMVARFESERQALALMVHPNIAQIYDGGATESGRPYFVMELVRGVTITDFCDKNHLPAEDRLKLFVTVCHAIQHAHHKGIIHRDIKPTNVMITLHDGVPVVKVIDFGVAKATAQKLTEKTLFTAYGQMIGTPTYMSPEQAEMSGLDVDTRTDTYSLGVLLYELLTGTTPFDKERLGSVGFDELRRIICEEEPPKPSTRISTLGQAATTIVTDRQSDPRRLSQLLRGELDWIVMKALEKDRTRRYETASALARDIERYLNNEPVEAGRPTAGYRLRKFLRRNKGPVSAVSLVLLALIVGIIGTTLGMMRADQRRVEADEARGREAEQRQMAENARDRTRQVLDDMTSSVTGDSLTTQKELSAEQKTFLTRVLTYYKELAGEKADDEQSRARSAAAAGRVGTIEYRLGRKLEAAAANEVALDGYAQLTAAFPAVPQYRRALALNHDNRGVLLRDLGKLPEAEEQFRQALAMLKKLADDFPAVPAYQLDLATRHTNLGVVLGNLGRWPEAEEQDRQGLEIQEKLVAKYPVVPEYRERLAFMQNNLGLCLSNRGKRPEAEEQDRRALAVLEELAADFPDEPQYRYYLAETHCRLGSLLDDLGKRPEAEEKHRRGLAIRERLATDFPAAPKYRQDLAISHYSLGSLLAGLGQRPEAEEHYRQALAIQEKLAADFPAVPAYRQDLAHSHDVLGILLAELGKRPEAQEQYRQALDIQEKLAVDFPTVPAYRQDLASSRFYLGILLVYLGKRPEAEGQYRQAVDILEKLAVDFPTESGYRRDLARNHNSLGVVLDEMGKRSQAYEHYRQALATWEKLVNDFPTVPGYRSDLAHAHNNLGSLFNAMGKWPAAEEQYAQALTILQKLAADFPGVPGYQIDLGGGFCNFGSLICARGQPGASLEWFDKAIRTLSAVHEQDRRQVVARQFLSNSHFGRAYVFDRLGKYAQAVQDWDRAFALSPREEQGRISALRAASRIRAGQVAEAVAEVAELVAPVADTPSQRWNADQWYGFACVYALASGKIVDKKQEYADRAMVLLQRAVKAGYRDVAHMKKDSDLDPLRARAEFHKLVDELANKTPAGTPKLP